MKVISHESLVMYYDDYMDNHQDLKGIRKYE
jgi:hypothetical protein